MESLDGKVAWVTGAGSGIGQAVAAALAGAGATVVVSGRRAEALAETVGMVEAAGGRATAAPLDVRDRDAVKACAAAIGRDQGRLDILVNNAGINVAERNWANIDLDQWDQVVDINVKGLYGCVAAALPLMRAQNDGLIVNIASWAGRYDAVLAGACYSATKHAVLSLNAHINMEECAHGIRACAICPAEVATPILDKRPVPVSAEAKAKMLQTEDLAETVLFVARMPARACLNEILISPTWNRFYLGSGPGAAKNPA